MLVNFFVLLYWLPNLIKKVMKTVFIAFRCYRIANCDFSLKRWRKSFQWERWLVSGYKRCWRICSLYQVNTEAKKCIWLHCNSGKPWTKSSITACYRVRWHSLLAYTEEDFQVQNDTGGHWLLSETWEADCMDMPHSRKTPWRSFTQDGRVGEYCAQSSYDHVKSTTKL